ncbi:hypothetical protein DXG03_007848, partial [Asterophora parasitica]
MDRDAQESTPLLREAGRIPPRTDLDHQLPPINPAVRRVGALQADQIHFEDLVRDQNGLRFDFENHPTEVAFALVVLLQLRRNRKKPSAAHDLYERWLATNGDEQDAGYLEKQVDAMWALFLAEYRSAQDIATVLWHQFPLDRAGTTLCRVVDFLTDADSPRSLSSHPLVISSLEDAWKSGIFIRPSYSRFIPYDALATPRVAHFIDWIAHLAFLVLLVRYLLYPIEQPHTLVGGLEYQWGAREAFLVLLPLSFAARSRTLASIGSLLVTLAFLASLPSVPHPDSASFTLLQWAATLLPLGLNLPQAPSHLFLLQHSNSLPLAIVVTQGLSRLLPVIVSFLPLLLLATYLLSLSLVDAFFRTLSDQFSPTPMETRFTFLCLFLIVVSLLVASIFVLATSTSSGQVSQDPWERYSPSTGESARRAFLRATTSYIGPYPFPAPFNLLHILLIGLARDVARQFRVRIPGLEVAERILWRVVVGPFSAHYGYNSDRNSDLNFQTPAHVLRADHLAMSRRSSKRQRTGGVSSFGASFEADASSSQQNNPSSSASSTRRLPISVAPALTTLCARVFAANFVRLRNNEDVWARVSSQLKALPEVLIPRIFAILQSICPTYLAHEVIVTYFLRGPSIILSKELPGVKQRTLIDIARINPDVHELELTNFDDISDGVFANLLRSLSGLNRLVLR